MLEIRNLHAGVVGFEILKGVNLSIAAGELHAIMGPNGSGKSTLAYVLAGHPSYNVTSGEVSFQRKDLLSMLPEDRARAGVFLSFQQPAEIRGVRLDHFLRAGTNSVRKSKGEEELDVLKFNRILKEQVKLDGIDPSFLKRSVNDGFSGGEKKRSEILQMALFEPSLAILDEPDSGLDVDAMSTVARGINRLRRPDRAIILVTHYQRILQHVIPDRVHIFMNGRIVMSGDKDLATQIEDKGYEWVESNDIKSSSP
jgi:Fe-S cluster assembly ATP-binding protein